MTALEIDPKKSYTAPLFTQKADFLHRDDLLHKALNPLHKFHMTALKTPQHDVVRVSA